MSLQIVNHKIIFCIIILIFLIPCTISSSYAQSTDGIGIILNIPPKMIVGESYEGMITLLQPSKSNSIGIISSGNDFVLETQKSLKISMNENHGLFSIYPLNEGETTITVLYDGKLFETQTKVYSKKSDAQKLKIILPTNNTLATDLKGFVFLLDGNNSPIESTFDRIISLTTSEKIITPTNITILNGSSHSVFDVTVRSTGEITAIAPQLKPHTISIEKSQEIIDVKIGIAPNIVLEESYTNYFVWLEKDGKPYTVKSVQSIEIQSSNTDIVRLELSPNSHKNENTISVSMYDGISKGRLYTGQSGISEISVSVPSYGHASSMVHVGTTLLGGVDNDNTISNEEYDESDINNIQFWIYPDITNDYSYGVASLYHAEQTEEISVTVDGDDVQITNIVDQTVLVPVKTEDALISISSQSGLSYDSSYTLDDVSFPTHSKVFEINAESVGDYTITATGGNSFDSATLKVTTDHDSEYSIKITELPTISHSSQPLIMVTVVDNDEKLVDISTLFGSMFSVDVYSTNATISSSSVIFKDNVGIVSGLLVGNSELSITSEKFGTTSSVLSPSGIATSIEIFTPSIIHSGESFPIVIHEVDSKGIPISKKDISQISTSGFDKFDTDKVIINDSGFQNISILSVLGGGIQTSIESFMNKLSFNIDVDNTSPRLGESITIKIDSPIDGINYKIDTPFPFNKIDSNTFEITPDYEISNAVITIIGTLDGFETTNKNVSISSVNLVEINIDTKTLNNDIISPDFEMKLISGTSELTTPYRDTIFPQSVILTFPNEWKSLDGGYKIIGITLDGKLVNSNIVKFYADTDKQITVTYDRFIKVTVNNGEGSGVYSLGDEVIISALDKPIIPVLASETLDYWIGTEQKSSLFVITPQNDFTVTAIYKDDYSILMIVIMVIVVGIIVLVVKKGDSGLKYKVEEHVEKILEVFKGVIPHKKG